ncbi:glycoprotease [Lentinus tigrinus ALCF2SS1-7]|uniref:N(6)-L-threonylcarbamoyladenine synthase n=1 Tax=Lentinus tigrinus ALCF2SS1-6 TaxID=1328759 RepID=A0A5C2RUD7_9APHY|nr:glycoprotease [Lentinus tigrinus ALCF2SS1-6]RPD73823.1 glycoprotease [Lentinus tigrinus ALCF2SS1-7]
MRYANLLRTRLPSLSITCSLRHGTSRRFTVLALESSADDSCAAVVTSDRKILSNVVINQQAFVEEYGGIHPFVALHAHQRNMPGAVQRALKEANLTINEVDGIAFTRGPGIPGCLSVCGNAARTLAAAVNKPLVGVHHMQAHALTPFLTSPTEALPTFPFLTLLVSGGHTLLLLATSRIAFRILATTLDESIGNAYDKVAKLLKIPYSGRAPGAALEQFCTSGEDDAPEIHMPRPMRGRLAFSYTGLHSTVERYLDAQRGELDECARLGIARSFQKAAVGQLEDKLALGIQQCTQRGIKVQHLVVSGGVASNTFLRERLRACLDAESPDERIELVFPPPHLCTDNAAMIAWAAMDRFLAGDTDEYSLESRPKWSLEDLEAGEGESNR